MPAPIVGTAHALSLLGMEASDVLVEAVLLGGLPSMSIVGLPDTAVSEARERLRASFSRIGVQWPNQRLTVNLSPADTAKSGTAFDLSIAIAIFGALGYRGFSRRMVILGELGLDGSVRAVRGVVPCALAAQKAGYTHIMLPQANELEARLVPGLQVLPVRHLSQVANMLGVPDVAFETSDISSGRAGALMSDGDDDACRAVSEQADPGNGSVLIEDTPTEFADVYGQEEAIWALQIAAVGGHHVQLVGAPGIGKSMLASRFPSILPELNESEAVDVAAIRSLAGLRVAELPKIRPFFAPHHTATVPAIVGGGAGIPQPGAITFAHHGVLFCDEFPEFAPRAIQALRQPMETGWVELHRAQAHVRYPARFQLIAAANPCRCGKALDTAGSCSCTPRERMAYRSNLGGPVRDRFDIRLVLRRPSKAALALGGQLSTAQAREAVLEACERSRVRARSVSGDREYVSNAQLSGVWLREHTRLSDAMTSVIDHQLSAGQLSLRGLDRVLRLSWSVADISGHDSPTDDDIAQAFMLRGSDDIYG